jgi:Bacterial regulatory helix-turn-helix protein, lysR family
VNLTNLDLDTLRTLATAHDLGGFAQAADPLGRTPSAISLQMKRLQDELGMPLSKEWARAIAHGSRRDNTQLCPPHPRFE